MKIDYKESLHYKKTEENNRRISCAASKADLVEMRYYSSLSNADYGKQKTTQQYLSKKNK